MPFGRWATRRAASANVGFSRSVRDRALGRTRPNPYTRTIYGFFIFQKYIHPSHMGQVTAALAKRAVTVGCSVLGRNSVRSRHGPCLRCDSPFGDGSLG